MDLDDLPPEARAAAERFAEALEEVANRGIDEGVDADVFREAFEAETIRAFRAQLEVRACPDEKIAELLSEVEFEPVPAEPGDPGYVVRFDFWLPTEMQDWLQRRPVVYDAGKPPV